ncbi:DUF3168 domain-containing protein [Sphingomicrobium arenosum]|uniref:DUF3168 domain-containing protein n=1 Tax=Sphingomicrobium arenosum TaxID=2233861 RepID=UPI00223F4531|nr:DUF3168 domain-containing protein [Sphingomicrobium arenosum]
MSAGAALQAAMVAALGALEEVTGIYDGPPARATFPYVAVDARNERDWGHKTGVGREVYAAVTLWDEEPTRLERIGGAIEPALAMMNAPAEWQLVGFDFARRKVSRDVAGPWAMTLDFRARLLAQ